MAWVAAKSHATPPLHAGTLPEPREALRLSCSPCGPRQGRPASKHLASAINPVLVCQSHAMRTTPHRFYASFNSTCAKLNQHKNAFGSQGVGLAWRVHHGMGNAAAVSTGTAQHLSNTAMQFSIWGCEAVPVPMWLQHAWLSCGHKAQCSALGALRWAAQPCMQQDSRRAQLGAALSVALKLQMLQSIRHASVRHDGHQQSMTGTPCCSVHCCGRSRILQQGQYI